MPKSINLAGQKFGYWKVIERSEQCKTAQAMWLCECKCGTRKVVSSSSLRKGQSRSCGCLARELSSQRKTTHGMKGTRLYNIWQSMKQRTTNANNNEYCFYGERGIEICSEWNENFEAFMEWAYNNGYQDNLTIDRKDNSKGYSPSNCRWITIKKQQANKRSNHYLTYNGETKTIAEWSEITGIGKETLRCRIVKLGWDVEKALTTKTRRKNNKQKNN